MTLTYIRIGSDLFHIAELGDRTRGFDLEQIRYNYVMLSPSK